MFASQLLDKATTYREPDFRCDLAALHIERSKFHRIGVTIELSLRIENNISIEIERNYSNPRKLHRTVIADFLEEPAGFVGVDLVGSLSSKTKNYGFVCGMSLPGPCQRSKESCLNASESWSTIPLQATDKFRGSIHRSDRMRGRWADPNLEEIQHPNREL